MKIVVFYAHVYYGHSEFPRRVNVFARENNEMARTDALCDHLWGPNSIAPIEYRDFYTALCHLNLDLEKLIRDDGSGYKNTE